MVSGYRISHQFEEQNIRTIHGFLATSYWAKGIPLNTLQKALKNSLCFGVFTEAGEQVGFARVITDYATFAYLADVFVVEKHRGRSLSVWLMDEIHRHPDLQGLRRMLLATSDAHGLYQQYGFNSLSSPSVFMEIWQPDVYKNRLG